MTAFVPEDPWAVLVLMAVVFSVFVLGYVLQRNALSVWTLPAAWSVALGFPLALERLFDYEPPGFRMLAIITPLYFGMKAVTGVIHARDSGRPLSFTRWTIFALLWPGMRPRLFSQPRRKLTGAGEMAIHGLLRIIAGVAIFFLARWWIGNIRVVAGWSGNIWIAAALVLVSISLIMHFGLFGIAAAVLRRAGFDCRPLFRAPLHARTVSEFWSRRWNLAFSEMMSIAVQRPLAKKTSPNLAGLGAFACSGLFHEMAISWPVKFGYGLPMLYFIIQGAFVILESKLALGRIASKFLTALVIIVPLPLLFHPWFLLDVVIPLL